MKKVILIAIIGMFSQLGFSQSPLGDGGVQINGGLGFRDSDGTPVYFGADFGVAQNVTVGPVAAFSDDLFSIGANVNYHLDDALNLSPEWNLYGGATVSYIDSDNSDYEDIDLGLQIGGRYFFSPTVGINLEAGGGTEITGGKLGLTVIVK